MKNRSRSLRFVKAIFAAIALLIGFLGYTQSLKTSASVNGPAASHTNAPGEGNCTSCHVDFPLNSGKGSLAISGLPANYRPGEQVPITVTLSQPTAVAYGFQLTAIDGRGRPAGTYTLPTNDPPQLQQVAGFVNGVQRFYVEHTFNGVTPMQFGTKSWNFTWTAPAERVGKISFYAAGNAADSDGSTGGDRIFTTSKATLSGSAISSFDTDGISDLAVFRPSEGVWYSVGGSGYLVVPFGQNGDRIVPGDYNGDGITDRAVWRPSNGTWYFVNSSGYFVRQFGQAGDIPVSGDFDGDLKTDLAVWRPTEGNWYILRSSDSGYFVRQFGENGDITTQGDYDADGVTDLAVFRPQTGVWHLLLSKSGAYTTRSFGVSGDRPVQADYDGDGRADLAVFRPSENAWYVLRSTEGYTVIQFGAAGDTPTPADYDGDGKTDIAIFRDGEWYILGSNGPTYTVRQFGQAGDVPIPSGYISN